MLAGAEGLAWAAAAIAAVQLYTARSSSTLERALQTLSGMQPAGEEEEQVPAAVLHPLPWLTSMHASGCAACASAPASRLPPVGPAPARMTLEADSHRCCRCVVLQEFLELKEKFEIGLGEARAYHALARQAQNLAAPAGKPAPAASCTGLFVVRSLLRFGVIRCFSASPP